MSNDDSPVASDVEYGEDVQAVVEIEVSYRVRVRLDGATAAMNMNELRKRAYEAYDSPRNRDERVRARTTDDLFRARIADTPNIRIANQNIKLLGVQTAPRNGETIRL